MYITVSRETVSLIYGTHVAGRGPELLSACLSETFTESFWLPLAKFCRMEKRMARSFQTPTRFHYDPRALGVFGVVGW